MKYFIGLALFLLLVFGSAFLANDDGNYFSNVLSSSAEESEQLNDEQISFADQLVTFAFIYNPTKGELAYDVVRSGNFLSTKSLNFLRNNESAFMIDIYDAQAWEEMFDLATEHYEYFYRTNNYYFVIRNFRLSKSELSKLTESFSAEDLN